MNPEDLQLSPACTAAHVDAHSKKRVLELAAQLIADAHPALNPRELLNALLMRERLGSTALGDGVAIPHCRVGCPRILGALLSTAEPLDFDSPDDERVSLVFVLVVPEQEESRHLAVLAALAEVFGDEERRATLLQCDDAGSLHATMRAYLP